MLFYKKTLINDNISNLSFHFLRHKQVGTQVMRTVDK
jgi:hypothetical protein